MPVEETMDKIVALAKNRGFIFPGSEIYGGLANSWDYGPLGVLFKNNVKAAWGQRFVQENPYNVGVDCAILMNVIAGYDPRESTSVPEEVPDYRSFLGRGIEGWTVGIPREYFVAGIDPQGAATDDDDLRAKIVSRGSVDVQVCAAWQGRHLAQ